MATKMERLQIVLATAKNADVTLNETRRVADAYAFTYARGETLTNPQKAGVALREIKRAIRQVTRDAITSQAAAAAAAEAEAEATLDLGGDEDGGAE